MALKCSKRKPTAAKPNKWYGLDPKLIEFIWKQEGIRSSEDGTAVHDQEEKVLLATGVSTRDGKTIPVVPPLYEKLVGSIDPAGGTTYVYGGRKIAPVQRLSEGCYPEHFLYLKSVGICGQADLVEVVNGKLHVGDYKTYKELTTEGFRKFDGSTAKLLHCLGHLDDCKLEHATMQMSLYAYIILKQNPQLQIGSLTLYHIILKSAMVLNTQTREMEPMTDEYGYPVYMRDENGVPLVEKTVPYNVPYRKKEVEDMLKWITANRNNLPKKH